MKKISEPVQAGGFTMSDFEGLEPSDIEDKIALLYGQELYQAFVNTFAGLLKDLMEIEEDESEKPDMEVLFSVDFFLDAEGRIVAYSKGYDDKEN